MHKLSLALAVIKLTTVTMNCEVKLGLDWSRSSMVALFHYAHSPPAAARGPMALALRPVHNLSFVLSL
jgi:hypothetical protein